MTEVRLPLNKQPAFMLWFQREPHLVHIKSSQIDSVISSYRIKCWMDSSWWIEISHLSTFTHVECCSNRYWQALCLFADLRKANDSIPKTQRTMGRERQLQLVMVKLWILNVFNKLIWNFLKFKIFNTCTSSFKNAGIWCFIFCFTTSIFFYIPEAFWLLVRLHIVLL